MQKMTNGMIPRMSVVPEELEVDDVARRMSRSKLSLSSESVLEGTLSRSGDHYHEDGNIILIAGGVKFRVYSGMLARRSSVFTDMFGLPQPTNGRESSPSPNKRSFQQMLDGVPAITLMDDPNDLTHLLDLVLPVASPYKPFESPSFDSLSATLILSTKYCFDDLREWAMACILHRFPHTLEKVAAHPNLSAYKDPIIAARLVFLARRADIPQLLPMAFYALAASTWDGGVSQYEEALRFLDHRDNARLGTGLRKMQDEVLKRAAVMPENGMMGSDCHETTANGSVCLIGRPSNIWGDMVERLQSLVRDPIREYGVRLASKGQYYNLCPSCDAAVVSGSELARKELFEMLPTLFQLVSSS